ncbi:MAG: hypothetical protein ACYT04_55030, partial [Nostoc sp.]
GLDMPQPPQSDPKWEFYIIWHSCEHSKALIDKALEIMNREKFPNAELYEEARQMILSASRVLQEQGHLT